MEPAPAIGIDLGTTFSVAAVLKKTITECIPDETGQRIIPSYVFYSPFNSKISVGSEAEKDGAKYPKNFFYDIKRIIGRKYDDIYVQKLKKSEDYPFHIVPGRDNNAEVEFEYDGKITQKTPEEVCSEILKYLRQSASKNLGKEVNEAVISVPAHFSNAQRKATQKAAELAGLHVLRLITEPVAAAVHYAEDQLNHKATLLVFDFGGGTLDVSIIEVDDKTFKVKCVEGDTFLGGRDFDDKVIELYKTEMIKKYGEKIREKLNTKHSRKIKKICRDLKTSLSTRHRAVSDPIEILLEIEETDCDVSISRADFENTTADLVERAKMIVEKCLREAGISIKDITDVLLVGGTTRVPKVKEMLSSYFGETKIKTDVNPDEAVARGAAMQATNSKEFEKYKITEITPLSLGLAVDGNLMEVVIKKSTPLPVKSDPIRVCTVVNNQKSVEFNIFEGERKNCEYNNCLGSFIIDNLPPGKAGEVQLEAKYSLNEDGILEVEAYETSTKKKNKLSVTIGEYRLCDYKIKNVYDDAEKYKKEDESFEQHVKLRNKLKRICNHILYSLNSLSSDRDFVEKKCKEMKHFLKSSEHLELDEIKYEFRKFSKAIRGIIDKPINIELFEVDDSLDIPLTSPPQPEIPSVAKKISPKKIIKKKHK